MRGDDLQQPVRPASQNQPNGPNQRGGLGPPAQESNERPVDLIDLFSENCK